MMATNWPRVRSSGSHCPLPISPATSYRSPSPVASFQFPTNQVAINHNASPLQVTIY